MTIACIGYLFFFTVVVIVEVSRVRRVGWPDFMTLFIVMMCIQLIIPPLLTTGLLAFFGKGIDTGVPFYQRVIGGLTPDVVWGVLMMTVCFWVAIYITWISLRKKFIGSVRSASHSQLEQRLRPTVYIIVMMMGIISMFYLLDLMGGIGLIGYANLIKLRSGTGDAPTLTIANLFTFTQTFALLSTLWVVRSVHCRQGIKVLFACLVAMFFSIMAVSRREVLLEFMVLYFTAILWTGKFRVKYLALAAIAALPILVLGKTLLYGMSLSQGANEGVADILNQRSSSLSFQSALLTVTLDLGRSVTDSWATMMYLHLSPRLGIDAMLSVLRRAFFWRTFGFDFQWPERIVRISTSTFISPLAQDEPPGLLGQMWLDFRFFGPFIWGIFLAAQLALLQRAYNRVRKSPEVVALYVIFFYVVSLVINTGSFDFSFSLDWILLIFISLFICHTVRVVGTRKENFRKPSSTES